MSTDNRPIGVFDSGLGGLTAVKEIMLRLPEEEIVFFGDTGRVPYGNRSEPTIIRYALQDLRFLRRFDIKAAVVACGTVSSTSMPALRADCDVPILGVVECASRAAARGTRNGRIGVIGTKASIRSGTYERLVHEANPDARCVCKACPLLVPLVEDGRISPEDPVVRLVLSEYLDSVLKEKVDTIILGCTHYPLLRDAIASICSKDVLLVDPGVEVAAELEAQLDADACRASAGKQGGLRCFVSDDAASFSQNGGLFLGRNITADVTQCDIESV